MYFSTDHLKVHHQVASAEKPSGIKKDDIRKKDYKGPISPETACVNIASSRGD